MTLYELLDRDTAPQEKRPGTCIQVIKNIKNVTGCRDTKRQKVRKQEG